MHKMFNFLNSNPGLIAVISIIISTIITVIGFFITNKNITKITQKQIIGDKSKGNQAGRNISDKSQNIGDGSNNNTQIKNDK